MSVSPSAIAAKTPLRVLVVEDCDDDLLLLLTSWIEAATL